MPPGRSRRWINVPSWVVLLAISCLLPWWSFLLAGPAGTVTGHLGVPFWWSWGHASAPTYTETGFGTVFTGGPAGATVPAALFLAGAAALGAGWGSTLAGRAPPRLLYPLASATVVVAIIWFLVLVDGEWDLPWSSLVGVELIGHHRLWYLAGPGAWAGLTSAVLAVRWGLRRNT